MFLDLFEQLIHEDHLYEKMQQHQHKVRCLLGFLFKISSKSLEHSVNFLIFSGLICNSNFDAKSFFKKNVGINDIKLALPHLSPKPLMVP